MSRSPRQLFAFLALSVLGLAGGCSQEPQLPTDEALTHLRHWVPYRSNGGLFFLHRFELREFDVQHVLPEWGKTHVPTVPDLPAVDLDQNQAWTVARAYLGRLPSLEEWRYAVGGDIGFRFPWGNREANPSYANTSELGLRERTRVGTFESGRDPTGQGCYDLIGNVAEWTSTPLALHPLALNPIGIPVMSASFERQREVLRAAESRLPISPFVSGVVPWMPELLLEEERRGMRYCTLGFSFAESLRVMETPGSSGNPIYESFWDDQGTRPRVPAESDSQLGLRLATDPYTFLARLESHVSDATAGDVGALETFLQAYKMDFKRAAKLRAQLHRGSLELPAPSALALRAWSILGIEP